MARAKKTRKPGQPDQTTGEFPAVETPDAAVLIEEKTGVTNLADLEAEIEKAETEAEADASTSIPNGKGVSVTARCEEAAEPSCS